MSREPRLPELPPGFRWRRPGGLIVLEAELEGSRAVFTTRLGGISEAPFDSLNLGVLTGDERAAVVGNRRRLTAAFGLDPRRVAIGRQVHGAELQAHDGPQSPPHFAQPGSAPPPEVDGHHTDERELAMLVLVADCLPIALAGPGGVAMLHGGWRGLAAGIVERGARAVSAVEAAIGPGIGPCCFEVGEEVQRRFAPLGDDLLDGRRLNLPRVAARQLADAGVELVRSAELCTSCNQGLFFSHRGGGPATGRCAGLVWKPR